MPRRSSFEGTGDPYPAFQHLSVGAYEGPAALEEVPRQYMDFVFAGVSPHSLPGTHPHQPKGYPVSMEATGFPVGSSGGPALPLPSPLYRTHMLVPGEPLAFGIQRSPSFQNKASENPSYAGLSSKGAALPLGSSHGFQPTGPVAGLYVPHPQHSHHKPHQLHVVGSRAPVFAGDSPPQSLLTPSRNSLNMDLYELNGAPGQQWPATTLSRRDSLQKQGLEAPPRPHAAFRPECAVPSRTNSFNSHQQPVATGRGTVPGKTEPSLPSPNTITAVTAAHILHPVKSVRVMRPEPQTAVGPSHPAWVPAAGVESLDPKEEHPTPLGAASSYSLEAEYGSPGPEMRCPPPPYPKHLMLPSKSEQFDVDDLCVGMEQGLRGSQAAEPTAERSDKSHKGTKMDKGGKDKKQIQTSPVPVRKNSRDEEKRESRIKSYSPYAFKFFMEQHVENVLKTYQQKVSRRLQLEQEMAKVIASSCSPSPQIQEPAA